MEIEDKIKMLMFAYGDAINNQKETIHIMKKYLIFIIDELSQSFKQKSSNFQKGKFLGNKKYTISHFLKNIFTENFKTFQKYHKVQEFISEKRFFKQDPSKNSDPFLQEEEELNLAHTERQLFLSKRIETMDESEYEFFIKSKETNFSQNSFEFQKMIHLEIYKPYLNKSECNLFLRFMNYILCKIIQSVVESILKKRQFLKFKILFEIQQKFKLFFLIFRHYGTFDSNDKKAISVEEIEVNGQIKIQNIQFKIKSYFRKNKNYKMVAFNLFKNEFYSQDYDKILENSVSAKQCWETFSNFHNYWIDRIKAEDLYKKYTSKKDFGNFYYSDIKEVENQYFHYLIKNAQQGKNSPDFAKLFKKYFIMRGQVEQEVPQQKSQRLESLFD